VTGSLSVDPATRLVYTTIGVTPVWSGGVPALGTYYYSDDAGATYLPIGWATFTTVGQEVTFKRPGPVAALTCKVAMVVGAIAYDPTTRIAAASLPSGAVVSAAFAVAKLAKPGAGLITSLTVTAAGSGNWPYNVVVEDAGRQYWSIPSISYSDAGALSDPNAFFVRITAQDLDASGNTVASEQAFAGTQVSESGATQIFGPLMGEYGTVGGSYTRSANIGKVRLRVYVCNRINQTYASFSDTNAATLQAGIGSGAGYVDVVVSTTGALPAGAIPGARVTGTVANATSATSATTATSATSATSAGYATSAGSASSAGYATSAGSASTVPGSGISGAITMGASGALTTVCWVYSGSTAVCWMGVNGSYSGIWAANAWFGGTGPSNPKIWLDSGGSAHFSGTIESGATITAPAISGGSLTITTSTATVSISSSTTGIRINASTGAGASLVIDYGGAFTTTITPSTLNVAGTRLGPGLGLYFYSSQQIITDGGQFVGAGVSCASYGVTCYSATVGAGGISCNGVSVINSSGQFIGVGVNCPSYGVAASGFNPYVSGSQYYGVASVDKWVMRSVGGSSQTINYKDWNGANQSITVMTGYTWTYAMLSVRGGAVVAFYDL